jgi:small subunit ribosomal protein S16
MSLKIRLRQQGRTNHLTYRLVLTEERTRRDGKYQEQLGWYKPEEKENTISVDGERIEYWLTKGAQLTEKARSLVKQAAPEVIKALDAREAAKKAKARAQRKKK